MAQAVLGTDAIGRPPFVHHRVLIDASANVTVGNMRDYHHGDLRAVLLREGRQVVRTQGLDGLSLRDVARRAGVTHPAVYRHFADRGELIAVLASEAMNELGDAMHAAERAAGTDPRRAILAIGKAYVLWAIGAPMAFRAAFAEELWDKTGYVGLRAAADRASEPLLRQVASLVGDDREVARRLAVALWSQAHGLATLAVDGQLHQGELSVSDHGEEAIAWQLTLAFSAVLDGWTEPGE